MQHDCSIIMTCQFICLIVTICRQCLFKIHEISCTLIFFNNKIIIFLYYQLIKLCKKVAPRRCGDIASYVIFLYTLFKREVAMKRLCQVRLVQVLWPLLYFIECTKRGQKRRCHQNDEVPKVFFVYYQDILRYKYINLMFLVSLIDSL